jgi:transcriptional regulator with XRE-family HTH domain
MEGRGFLKAVHANPQTEALVVRGISDLIARKHVSDAQGYQAMAARHASAFAFEVLENLENASPDGQWILVLTGTVSDVHVPIIQAMTSHLRTLSGDMELTLTQVLSGSIILVLEGSLSGFERVSELIRTRQLTTLAGLPVLTAEWQRDYKPGLIHSPSSQLLALPAVSYNVPRLRELMNQHAISSPHLAGVANLSQRTISEIASGRRAGSLESWRRILAALHALTGEDYSLREVLGPDYDLQHLPWPIAVSPRNEIRCYTIIPNRPPFADYYQRVIAPTVLKFGAVPMIASDFRNLRGSTVENIKAHISAAAFCIADVTGVSGDVMYELGVAQSLDKDVIIITQRPEDLPARLIDVSAIPYDPSVDSWEDDFRESLIIQLDGLFTLRGWSNRLNQ